MRKNEVKKNAFATKGDLHSCGWQFAYSVGNLEVWTQAKELMFYNAKTQTILRVQQKI